MQSLQWKSWFTITLVCTMHCSSASPSTLAPQRQDDAGMPESGSDSGVDGGADGSMPPTGCAPGVDQTCNSSTGSTLSGRCTATGQCDCYAGASLDPGTGKCLGTPTVPLPGCSTLKQDCANASDACYSDGDTPVCLPAGTISPGGVCTVSADCVRWSECYQGKCYQGCDYWQNQFGIACPPGTQCHVLWTSSQLPGACL
jgi:hypothetical protein